MRRRGRPKKDQPREVVVSFRLTEDAYRALQTQAMRRGLASAAYARTVVEHYVKHTGDVSRALGDERR